MFKRIELIEGSSTSEEIIEKIRKVVPKSFKVIVCLDSNNTKNHVLERLRLYHRFVNPGSYVVVFDTNTSMLAELGACEKSYINKSPKETVDESLKEHSDFKVEKLR